MDRAHHSQRVTRLPAALPQRVRGDTVSTWNKTPAPVRRISVPSTKLHLDRAWLWPEHEQIPHFVLSAMTGRKNPAKQPNYPNGFDKFAIPQSSEFQHLLPATRSRCESRATRTSIRYKDNLRPTGRINAKSSKHALSQRDNRRGTSTVTPRPSREGGHKCNSMIFLSPVPGRTPLLPLRTG